MDAKEISEFLGITAENLDEFKTAFTGKYFTEKQVLSNPDMTNKIMGKRLGLIHNEIVKKARDLGVQFTREEFDNKPLEEVFDTIVTRYGEDYSTKIKDLESKVGKSGDEVVKQWEEKYNKLEHSYTQEKQAKKTLADEYEGFKKTATTEKKNVILGFEKNKVLSSVPYADNDPLKIEGWKSHVEKNFKWDFDENDRPIIMDKDGNKIPNPKKAGEWLEPQDVILMEAEKFPGLIKKNPQGGRPAFVPASGPPVPPSGVGFPKTAVPTPATPGAAPRPSGQRVIDRALPKE